MNQEIQCYTHEQPMASTSWVIKHNLNCHPGIQVFVRNEGKLVRIIPHAIVADNQMQVTVTFTAPFAGHAILQ